MVMDLPTNTARDGVPPPIARRTEPRAPTPARPLTAPLPRSAADLLRDLGRWGFLTIGQAAALRHHSHGPVYTGGRELRRLGLATTHHLSRVTPSGIRHAYALTDAGRRAFHRLPDHPLLTKAPLDLIDRLLAGVDLALELREQEGGTWLTWAEYRRLHAATLANGWPLSRLELGPAGVLRSPDGRHTPIWLVVRPQDVGKLYDAVGELTPRRELEYSRMYVHPAFLETVKLRFYGHRTWDIRGWEAPHLAGRAVLQTGWARPFAGPRRGDGQAAALARPIRPLGPRQLAVLGFLDRFGYATPEQIARGQDVAANTIRTVLRTLEAGGRAQRLRGRRGPKNRVQEDIWSTTAAGLAAIGSPRSALPSTPLHRAHSLALVDLAHQMEAETGGKWEAEREIARETVVESRRHHRQGNWRDKTPPPDGRITLPDGRRIVVQLQRTAGRGSQLCAFAREQIWQGLGDQVWIVCVPEVAPRYRRRILPHEIDLMRVVEWTPPDRSAGLREPRPGGVARQRREAAARRAARTDART